VFAHFGQLRAQRPNYPGGTMETFCARASRSNGTAVVAVHGDVDLYTAPRLWETIDAATTEIPRELVLDLTDVRFLDSSGLNVLIRAHKRLRPVAGTVVIRGAKDQVSMALEVTKLNTVLTVESATPTN
jgi:anti-sigma B factor antagonist